MDKLGGKWLTLNACVQFWITIEKAVLNCMKYFNDVSCSSFPMIKLYIEVKGQNCDRKYIDRSNPHIK